MKVTKISTVTLVKNHLHIKNIHEGHKDFKCDSCEKSFTQPGDLRKHIKNIHEGHKYKPEYYREINVTAERRFHCNLCEKMYTKFHNLKFHISKVHEGTKPVQPKSQKSSLHLKTHTKRLHDNDRKEKFHENEIAKKDKNETTIHEKTNYDENVTKNTEKLLQYKRNHENFEIEKEEECDLNKLSQLELKTIINKLSGKNNYKCQKCAKEFVNSLSLEKHTIAVHEEKRNVRDNIYKCHKCATAFSRQIFLNSHSCNVHEGVKNQAHREKVQPKQNKHIETELVIVPDLIDTENDDKSNVQLVLTDPLSLTK